MVHPDLLEILACPEDKTPVRLMEAAPLAALNERIKKGAVKTRGGQPVTEALEAALVRDDGKYAYPVREDIPIMLIDEAIPLVTDHS
jgi:uncharacterized protein YbaR (Trm112 family)